MSRTRKVVAAVLAVAALAIVGAPPAFGGDDHKCSPGQHGNPHPGFKPGSC